MAIWIGIVKNLDAPSRHWKEDHLLVITWLYSMWLHVHPHSDIVNNRAPPALVGVMTMVNTLFKLIEIVNEIRLNINHSCKAYFQHQSWTPDGSTEQMQSEYEPNKWINWIQKNNVEINFHYITLRYIIDIQVLDLTLRSINEYFLWFHWL